MSRMKKRRYCRSYPWPSVSAVVNNLPIAPLLLLLAAATGCGRGGPAPSSGRHASQSVTSGSVLLQNVTDTLNNLDQAVRTELRVPTVVLDASKSNNGKDVLATLTAASDRSGRPRYILKATSGNVSFRRIDVRAGDWVRFFVSDRVLAAQINVLQSSEMQRLLRAGKALDDAVFQERVQRELQGLGDARSHHFELPIYGVVDDVTLQVAGLPLEVNSPERLEIWRYSTGRIESIVRRLNRYVRRGQPKWAWEPTPDESVLEQVIERLNQWLRRQGAEAAWRPDPLVATLPAPLEKYVAAETLARLSFSRTDGPLLREAVWLRDISRWARGDSLDDVGRAAALFDWTVRNVQLETEPSLGGRAQQLWETVLFGQGTVEDRARLFIGLCRQQRLDAVLLARPDPRQPEHLLPWVVALCGGDQLTLFDPWLGLPIPGPDEARPATLAEVRADPGLLEALDLDGQTPYPVHAKQLQGLVALVDSSPLSLSKRAAALEARLTGDARMAIATHPSELAKRVRTVAGIDSVRLWEMPYRTLRRQGARKKKRRLAAKEQFDPFVWIPVLWKGRVLHFKGQFNGEESAKSFYRMARPANARIEKDRALSARIANLEKRAKTDASLWLGLVAFEGGNYRVAVDYLQRRTLSTAPEGPRADAARYNLARAYEALGQWDNAKRLYLADRSAQQHGNRLRARRLEEKRQ